MTWFEVGLKFGLGLLAALAIVGLILLIAGAVVIACTEHEQRKLHRQTECEMVKWGGTD